MLIVSLWKQTPNAMHVAEIINVKFLSEVKQKVSLCFWYLSMLYSIVIVALLLEMDGFVIAAFYCSLVSKNEKRAGVCNDV